MPTLQLTDALRADYRALFESCVIPVNRRAAVEALVNRIEANQGRYRALQSRLGVPWAFAAVVHNMESSQNFQCHLHNGDPLTARTRLVPAGRPRTGNPPFTWEVSAADALTMKGLDGNTDWTMAGLLYQLERYNGWGYRIYHPHVRSPYLWSFSNHYVSGKYVADGRWSETAVSQQCGAAVILRRIVERRLFAFPDQPFPTASSRPLVVQFRQSKSTNPVLVQHAENLQVWLNSHAGIFVRPDGVPGRKTSDAYKSVTGEYLPGDPLG
jgi:lysozyme family protein